MSRLNPRRISTKRLPRTLKKVRVPKSVRKDYAGKSLKKSISNRKKRYTGRHTELSGINKWYGGLKPQRESQDSHVRLLSTHWGKSTKEKEYRRQERIRLQATRTKNRYDKPINRQVLGVRRRQSSAMKAGLASRGTTGAFGRSGLRISSLNLA